MKLTLEFNLPAHMLLACLLGITALLVAAI